MKYTTLIIVLAVALLFSELSTALSHSTAVSVLDENFDLHEAVRVFDEWFDAHYKLKRSVKLAVAGEGMRLGVVATQRIAADSLYLSIPLNIIIYDNTIFSTNGIGVALQKVLKLVPSSFQKQQLALNLFLTHQRFVAGNRSFFHPYIQLLPSEHDVPEFYNDDDLALLKGTQIPSKARAERSRHRKEYEALVTVLRNFANVFPLHTFSYENYVWAQGILNTRMIWWDGVPHLVPLLDMINCRQGPKGHRVHSTKRGASNRADTYAPWEFQSGDQVFENYGQPNPTYFLWHGFAMEPNMHDCAQVVPSPVSFWSKATRVHQEAVQRLQLSRPEFCVRPDASKLEEFLTLARVVSMSENDAKLLKAPPTKFVSRVNEGKALTLVKKSVEAHLNAMKNESDIMAITDSLETPFRRKMIQLFLRGQRAILSETVDALEKRIAPLRRKKPQSSIEPSSESGNSDEL
ncbi:membrane-associated protein, putative [Bodo saltans]|uniref:Membrane-associated protein, putative n=1 Tax=Bodo saltans TaxID=75058 RepID=A0A0S4IW30_BODSA|nr:membrane-associated protein, putative [Bodo saltans]|eukprot:CUF24878.1 membrane-associated protein, putative [Bodo saltans]